MSRVLAFAWLFTALLVIPGRLCAQQFPADQASSPEAWGGSRASDDWRAELLGLEPNETPLDQHLPLTEDDLSSGLVQPAQTARNRPLSTGPLGEGRSPFKARAFWIPSQSLKGRAGSLGVNGEGLDVGFPLRIDPDGIWLGLGGVQRLEISTSASLPDSGLPIPSQLWDIELGVMHIRELSEGRQAGGMLRIGSPSDQPFGAWRDMTVMLLAFLTIPSGDRDAWSFSLFYSPTGQIIYPIPGIAYIWRPSAQFQANLGIPFSLEYKPTDKFTLTANYMPLNNIQVVARQTLGESWSIYGGYRTVNATFLLADRLDDQERTYLFDQRLTLGVQRSLGRGWSLDLSAAYVFDREMFQAEKFSGNRRDELKIDDGVAGTLQLLWTR